jgi:ferredoxin-thioredoxin reductase catalytic subunit
MRAGINPDTAYADEVRKKLRENQGYCPCRLEHSADTKCICLDFREQLERGEPGPCHCGLYIAYSDH